MLEEGFLVSGLALCGLQGESQFLELGLFLFKVGVEVPALRVQSLVLVSEGVQLLL